MADMVIPNEGLLKLAVQNWGVPGAAQEDFVVDLYSNNYTPVAGSSASNFTIATFTGYAQVAVARSTFGSPSIVGSTGNVTSSVSPTFTCTGGSSQTVYGWVMRGASSGKVYAAQLFTTAFTVVAGSNVQLTPFTLQTGSIP